MSAQKIATINKSAAKVKPTSKFQTVWTPVKAFLLLAKLTLGHLMPKIGPSVDTVIDTIDAAIANKLIK